MIASFDETSQRVLIEAQNSVNVLDIDSNGTGLFAALNIAEGRVDAVDRGAGFSRRRAYEISDAIGLLSEQLNVLFQDRSFAAGAAGAQLFRGPLASALRNALDGDSEGQVNLFGLRFDLEGTRSGRGTLISPDRNVLTRELQVRGATVQDFLQGADDQNGLITGLVNATRQALGNVNQRLGFSGTFVDILA